MHQCYCICIPPSLSHKIQELCIACKNVYCIPPSVAYRIHLSQCRWLQWFDKIQKVMLLSSISPWSGSMPAKGRSWAEAIRFWTNLFPALNIWKRMTNCCLLTSYFKFGERTVSKDSHYVFPTIEEGIMQRLMSCCNGWQWWHRCCQEITLMAVELIRWQLAVELTRWQWSSSFDGAHAMTV